MGNIQASYTVEIDAPLAEVYEVAADVPGAVEWNPAIQKVTVIETDDEGRATLVETEADVKVKTAKSILRFSYDEPNGLSLGPGEGRRQVGPRALGVHRARRGTHPGRLRPRRRPRPHARHAPPRPRRRPGQDVPDKGRRRGPEEALRGRLAPGAGNVGRLVPGIREQNRPRPTSTRIALRFSGPGGQTGESRRT